MSLADDNVHQYPRRGPGSEGDAVVPGVQDHLTGQRVFCVQQEPVTLQTRGLVNHLAAVLTPCPVRALAEVRTPSVMAGACWDYFNTVETLMKCWAVLHVLDKKAFCNTFITQISQNRVLK